jgi:hypothetical protein
VGAQEAAAVYNDSLVGSAVCVNSVQQQDIVSFSFVFTFDITVMYLFRKH